MKLTTKGMYTCWHQSSGSSSLTKKESELCEINTSLKDNISFCYYGYIHCNINTIATNHVYTLTDRAISYIL